MSVLEQVLADLAEEGAALEALVAPLDEAGWRTPTPAVGWDVATQVAHLAWTDEVATAAASDKERWDAIVAAGMADPERFIDDQALEGGRVPPAELLARWRRSRASLGEALRALPAGQKMPWFGPPMSATSMATARFMETWAHGLDVADALGAVVEPTDRIRHIAHIGVRTRNFSFGANGLEPPAEEFRIELRAPSGELWEWGPAEAEQRVGGSAYDFCLRVTQRRHRADLDLVAVGPDADRWLDLAQAFAGPPVPDGLRRTVPTVVEEPRARPEPVEGSVSKPGEPTEILRVGNCSGFYGDRLSAMRELLEGGELDVVTGDYLAELTMLILGKDQLKDPTLGYTRTFVRQVADCLALALEKDVRIVANAGGLNPAGLVDKLTEVAAGLGLSPRIAWVDGDDLAPRAADLGLDGALTANAYLGAFGIARALEAGADIVVTGRVTDASVVVGPAIWRFGWTPEQYDELAGAVVAGHVVECGTQATGGNFSGFLDLPRDGRPLGFPIAEIGSDGSCVITKHTGTGGLVSVDTVTAQLMYEVQSEHYLGPDVTVDLTTIALAPDGPDRVRVSGVRGLAPPPQLKVCVNELGGFRNQLEFVLTGLDIEAKAAWLRAQLDGRLTASSVSWSVGRIPAPDSETEEGASCLVRCVVKDADAAVAGKAFTSAAVELALGSYPGFTMTTPPGPASPYGVYRPAYVDRDVVTHTVHLPDGSTEVIPDPPVGAQPPAAIRPDLLDGLDGLDGEAVTRRAALGAFVHARSGDKGGDANVGLWVRHGDRQAERARWLERFLSVDRVRQLVPEAADLEIEVYPLPNLCGVNVLLRGLLGEGVAASTRFDPQAKGLGEWLRSRLVHIPEELL